MRIVKTALRPIYKLFFEKPLWWLLSRVKAYFLAEIGPDISQMGPRMAAMEERLRGAEASNAAQWKAVEHLVLALLSQPEARIDAKPESCRLHNDLSDLDPINERNDLR